MITGKAVLHLLKANSHHILTGTAIVGTMTFGVLASRATLKAQPIVEQFKEENNTETIQKHHYRDILSLTWKIYIPTGLAFTATAASIIALNRVGVRNAGAYALAATTAQNALNTYKESVKESLTDDQYDKVEKKHAQREVDANPPASEVVFTQPGDVLFMDEYSGRYFWSDVESIREAVNNVNQEIVHTLYSSLTEFYSEIGLEPTQSSDVVGWNSDQLLEVGFVPAEGPNKTPCFRLTYKPVPHSGYDSHF